MDIYNKIIDVYNSNSKKIIETFETKKNNATRNMGNMNIHSFYIIISILIIMSFVLPLGLFYVYQSEFFKIMFNISMQKNIVNNSSLTNNESLYKLSSESSPINTSLIKTSLETLSDTRTK